MAAIGALVAATRRERRVGALLLVGDPGIGKSRLLDEAGRTLDGERDLPVRRLRARVERAAGRGRPRCSAGSRRPARIGRSMGCSTPAPRSAASTPSGSSSRSIDSSPGSVPRPCSSTTSSGSTRSRSPCATSWSGRRPARAGASRSWSRRGRRPSPTVSRHRWRPSSATSRPSSPCRSGRSTATTASGWSSSRAGDRSGRGVALWERAGGSPFWLDLLAGAEGDERDVDAVVGGQDAGARCRCQPAARDPRDPRPAGRRARARGPGRVARGAIAIARPPTSWSGGSRSTTAAPRGWPTT